MNHGETSVKHCSTTAISFCWLAGILSAAWSSELTNDSLETIQRRISGKKAVLVDVREKLEWEQGHIEGAIFLPLSKLQQAVDAIALTKLLPKDKIIYTHCVAGVRSVKAE